MKKTRVKISWSKSTLLQQAGFARGTVSAMTSNVSFPTPAVTLTAMTAAAARLENAWANRNNGAVARDELENAATDLNDKLHTQAEYVDKIANGIDDIIHSAGFASTKPASDRLGRVAAPAAPTAPVLNSVAGGSIKATVDAVAGTKLYCFILVLDGSFTVSIANGQINVPAGCNAFIINSTKRTTVFTNLPTLKPVQVAAMVINSGGVSNLSTVVTGSTMA